MMRAAVLTAPGKIEIAEVAVPEPGPGEVRIRLEGCGVCASNLEPWAGLDWMSYPGEPGGLGHEGWGRIDAVGPEVDGCQPGERVAVISYHGFADYDLARADAVVKLPPPLGDKPFAGEPLACAFNIFLRSDIRAGHSVAIIGIGFLGAVLTRLASDAGARVIAISRRRESLDLARVYGAAETVPMNEHEAVIDRVRALTGDQMCPRVIEAVGKQWPLDLATALTGFGGKLVVAGYHQDGPRQVNMQEWNWNMHEWNWKGIDVINAHERDLSVQVRGMHEAVDAVASGRLDTEPLYSHRYSLDRLGDALDATRDKPGNFVKALVMLE
jgi:threonine dehydrogenase-like Zn-dependent dehydrogenase